MLRLRLYGRQAGEPPQAGVPLPITWESAFENLSRLPRMFAEPDGSFLWTGQNARAISWQLEGTLFDDGRVVRRIELIGNCPRQAWSDFLGALACEADHVSVESLTDEQVFDGHWLLSQAMDAASQ